jgi:hypothetical protein
VRRRSSGRTSWRGRAAPTCLQFLTTPVLVCSKMPRKKKDDSAGQSSKAAVSDGSSSGDNKEDAAAGAAGDAASRRSRAPAVGAQGAARQTDEDPFSGKLDHQRWARPSRGQGARVRGTRYGQGRDEQDQSQARMVCMHEDLLCNCVMMMPFVCSYRNKNNPSTNKMCVRRIPMSPYLRLLPRPLNRAWRYCKVRSSGNP